ncbi:MAG: hypothetical protein DRP84_12270 [Spirochaetes bacterium]|nr:MAG: hypothetical protein DRP84_12270 [Spirochaetota bacterium]
MKEKNVAKKKKKKKKLIKLILILFLSCCYKVYPFSLPFVKDEILVKLSSSNESYINYLCAQYHLHLLDGIEEIGLYRLKIIEDYENSLETLIYKLEKEKYVVYAQPNYLLFPTSDGEEEQAIDLLASVNFPPGLLEKLGIEIKYPAIVAVVDSGVDYTHEDLKDLIIKGYDFVDLCDVPNGIYDFHKFIHRDIEEDYLFLDNDPMDKNGHGTHVAGIIAQISHGKVKIMPVRAGFNLIVEIYHTPEGPKEINYGTFTTFSAIKSIIYAVNQGAKVINASWGGPPSQALIDALLYAQKHGVLVVVSAGNWDTDAPSYPSAFGLDNLISVAALGEDNEKAIFSNFGNYVTVSAPGVNIESTWLNNSYKILSGTSMAAPCVSGLAGLLFSAFPDFNYKEVKALIEKSAEEINDINRQYNGTLGTGKINVANCMANAKNYYELKRLLRDIESFMNGEITLAEFETRISAMVQNLIIPDSNRRNFLSIILDTVREDNDLRSAQLNILFSLWRNIEDKEGIKAAIPILIQRYNPEYVANWVESNGFVEEDDILLLSKTDSEFLSALLSYLTPENVAKVISRTFRDMKEILQLSLNLIDKYPEVWDFIMDNLNNLDFQNEEVAILQEINRVFVEGGDIDSKDSFLKGKDPAIQAAFEYLARYRAIELPKKVRHIDIMGVIRDKNGNPINGAIIKVTLPHPEELDLNLIDVPIRIEEKKYLLSHNYEYFRTQSETDGSYQIIGIPLDEGETQLLLEIYALTSMGYIKKTIPVRVNRNSELNLLDVTLDLQNQDIISPEEFIQQKIEQLVGRRLDTSSSTEAKILEFWLELFRKYQRQEYPGYNPLGNDYQLVPDKAVQNISNAFEVMEFLKPLIETYYGRNFDFGKEVHWDFMWYWLLHWKKYWEDRDSPDMGEIKNEAERAFRILNRLKPIFEESSGYKVDELPFCCFGFERMVFWFNKVEEMVKYEEYSEEEAIKTVLNWMQKILPYAEYIPDNNIQEALIFIDSIKEAQDYLMREVNLENEEDLDFVTQCYEFNKILSWDGDYHKINAGHLVALQEAFNTFVEDLDVDEIDIISMYEVIPEFQEHYLGREINYSSADDLRFLFYWDELSLWAKDPELTKNALLNIGFFEKLFGREVDIERDGLDLVRLARNLPRMERLLGEKIDLNNPEHFEFCRKFMLVINAGIGPAILDVNDDEAMLKVVEFIPYYEKLLGRTLEERDIFGMISTIKDLEKFEEYLGRKLNLDSEEDFDIWKDWYHIRMGDFSTRLNYWNLRYLVEDIEGRELHFYNSEDRELIHAYRQTEKYVSNFIEEYFNRTMVEYEEPDKSIWRDAAHMWVEGERDPVEIKIALYDKYIKGEPTGATDPIPCIFSEIPVSSEENEYSYSPINIEDLTSPNDLFL